MKYSVTGSLFLTLVSPFRIEAASYNCKVDGIYNILDDANNPMLPTTSDKAWAASKIMSSYNAVHSVYNNDFTLNSISVTGFDYAPARRLQENSSQEDKMDPPMPRLRGKSMDDAAANKWLKWRMKVKNNNNVGCRTCSAWDDDDSMRMEVVDIDATATHTRWEAAWCDELQQGGVLVFEYAMECTIDLYDCVLATEEILPSNSGGMIDMARTVESGMEDIAHEVAAEMAVQEIHQK